MMNELDSLLQDALIKQERQSSKLYEYTTLILQDNHWDSAIAITILVRAIITLNPGFLKNEDCYNKVTSFVTSLSYDEAACILFTASGMHIECMHSSDSIVTTGLCSSYNEEIECAFETEYIAKLNVMYSDCNI